MYILSLVISVRVTVVIVLEAWTEYRVPKSKHSRKDRFSACICIQSFSTYQIVPHIAALLLEKPFWGLEPSTSV